MKEKFDEYKYDALMFLISAIVGFLLAKLS